MESQDSGKQEEHGQAEEPGFWKKLEILSRPLSALLTALAVAAIGYWGNLTINEMTNEQERSKLQLANLQQKAQFKLSKEQQDTHLYTQLMAQREESESNLRKDMFTTILKDYLARPSTADSHIQIENQLLQLELLAQNFSESLSLHPLFAQLNRDIDKPVNYSKIEGEDQKADLASAYKSRLRSLARLVASRQIATIQSNESDVRTIYFSIKDIKDRGNRYEWPRHYVEDTQRDPQGNLPPDIEGQISVAQCLTLGRGFTRINLIFSRVHEFERTVAVNMSIVTRQLRKDIQYSEEELCNPASTIPLEAFDPDGGRRREDIDFNLDFYNFPLIDNTLLDGDNRLAVVLTNFKPKRSHDFNDGLVGVKLLLFPARYAARRDKPSLYQAIEQLRVDTDADSILPSSRYQQDEKQ